MDDVALAESIVKELERDFGGLDFWWLSKKWKKKHYREVAVRLIRTIRWNDEDETKDK